MTQPILTGFHPDPSICRVGGTYYLATSSFEYSPGVPIHRSDDLVSWDLVGNALDRPSQLRPSAGAKDSGIYAPTLRHHDGRFWLVTTDTARPYDGQLVTWSERAEGPWSDPVFVPQAIGIDPDLVWEETGTARLTWRSFHPDLFGIASAPVDLSTGVLLAEPAVLWEGTGLAHIEAPHLYRIGDWWYLLVAEGGTERGHVVSVARSRSVGGPYDGCPLNPILSHRSTDHDVQNTGHGDLVQLADGTWAMAYLGVRPRGVSPHFHVNGRESFLAGIDWVDGWPVVREDRFDVPVRDHSFTEDFRPPLLHPRWISPGSGPQSFCRPVDGGLALRADDGREARAIVATRALDIEWSATVPVDVSAGAARVLVRLDDDHWYGVELGPHGVRLVLNVGPAVGMPFASDTAVSSAVVRIRVRRRPDPMPFGTRPEPDMVGFFLRGDAGQEEFLGEYDGRYLSTEVAGGFTGRVWGAEVLSGEIVLGEVRYESGA